MRKKPPDSRRAMLAAIHIHAKNAGLIDGLGDKSKYEEMLQSVAGVSSASLLNEAGLRKVLAHLTGSGPRGPSVFDLKNPALRKKIGALTNLIEWKASDGFALWLLKRQGLKTIENPQQASAVIEGLKGMFENQMTAKFGPDWKAGEYDDPEIVKYIAYHGENKIRR